MRHIKYTGIFGISVAMIGFSMPVSAQDDQHIIGGASDPLFLVPVSISRLPKAPHEMAVAALPSASGRIFASIDCENSSYFIVLSFLSWDTELNLLPNGMYVQDYGRIIEKNKSEYRMIGGLDINSMSVDKPPLMSTKCMVRLVDDEIKTLIRAVGDKRELQKKINGNFWCKQFDQFGTESPASRLIVAGVLKCAKNPEDKDSHNS